MVFNLKAAYKRFLKWSLKEKQKTDNSLSYQILYLVLGQLSYYVTMWGHSARSAQNLQCHYTNLLLNLHQKPKIGPLWNSEKAQLLKHWKYIW